MAKKVKADEKNPWNRRDWPAVGDKIQESLYAAVGRAISEWERYEAALAFLFANFVTGGGPILLPARRAYGAIRTFEGRRDMLRAASEAYFFGAPNETMQEKFKSTILREAKHYSERRNDIAHGVVDHWRPEPPAAPVVPAPNEYALFPSFLSLPERDNESVPTYCYTSTELEYFRQEFAKLREPPLAFAAEIAVVARGAALPGKLRPLYRK